SVVRANRQAPVARKAVPAPLSLPGIIMRMRSGTTPPVVVPHAHYDAGQRRCREPSAEQVKKENPREYSRPGSKPRSACLREDARSRFLRLLRLRCRLHLPALRDLLQLEHILVDVQNVDLRVAELPRLRIAVGLEYVQLRRQIRKRLD